MCQCTVHRYLHVSMYSMYIPSCVSVQYVSPFMCQCTVHGHLHVSVYSMPGLSCVSVQYMDTFMCQCTVCGPPSCVSVQYAGPFMCHSTGCRLPLYVSGPVYIMWALFVCHCVVCGTLYMSVYSMWAPSYVSVQDMDPLYLFVYSMWVLPCVSVQWVGSQSYVWVQYVCPFVCPRSQNCQQFWDVYVVRYSWRMTEVLTWYTVNINEATVRTLLSKRSCRYCNERYETWEILYTFKKSKIIIMYCVTHMQSKVKQSRYTPWRLLGGEEI
jgi:hypothetical protein